MRNPLFTFLNIDYFLRNRSLSRYRFRIITRYKVRFIKRDLWKHQKFWKQFAIKIAFGGQSYAEDLIHRSHILRDETLHSFKFITLHQVLTLKESAHNEPKVLLRYTLSFEASSRRCSKHWKYSSGNDARYFPSWFFTKQKFWYCCCSSKLHERFWKKERAGQLTELIFRILKKLLEGWVQETVKVAQPSINRSSNPWGTFWASRNIFVIRIEDKHSPTSICTIADSRGLRSYKK